MAYLVSAFAEGVKPEYRDMLITERNSGRRVVIVQRRLTHYRVPFFEQLRTMLAERNICLELLVGKGTPDEEKKRDTGRMEWAKSVETHYFAGDRLCWQPLGRHLAGADLVVVTQENKLLYNHLLTMLPRHFRLAFWGHGANLQSGDPDGVKERFKRWTTNRVDWWFAYTQMSADLVKNVGFPDRKITVLNNAVDTSELQAHRRSISLDELHALRIELGLGNGPLGVFVGSFHADKRLEFLFASAEAIRRQIPGFQLLIIGDGPLRDEVQAWCAKHAWAHWAGARFGKEKVAHIALADVMLNPGLVGLGILDSFACKVPMVTTDCGLHSPEIAYLENGTNGLITGNTLDQYVRETALLLQSEVLRKRLMEGCEASSRHYSLDNMARNFVSGIEQCLGLNPIGALN